MGSFALRFIIDRLNQGFPRKKCQLHMKTDMTDWFRESASYCRSTVDGTTELTWR